MGLLLSTPCQLGTASLGQAARPYQVSFVQHDTVCICDLLQRLIDRPGALLAVIQVAFDVFGVDKGHHSVQFEVVSQLGEGEDVDDGARVGQACRLNDDVVELVPLGDDLRQ